MESNDARRRFSLNTLVAGLLGVIVGVLAMGLIPDLLRAQAPVNVPGNQDLEVTLILERGSAKTLELKGCTARENGSNEVQCVEQEKTIKRVFSGQASFEWNGEQGGSGCTTVGGKRYCW